MVARGEGTGKRGRAVRGAALRDPPRGTPEPRRALVYSPVDGALLGAVTTAEGAQLAPEDLGQLCFVGDELVVLSQRGLTYYRPERVAE
ncbi:hypothetical protein [Sorangium sp. So ce1182]|uniref:hypothetical protein n=1 Tax=Sorangium sp. So ce1182 TaxID=3133334 RepID=UPI003F5DCA28